MKVLCVAEKPSIAKSITQILSGGQSSHRESGHPYIRNYDFQYNLPPPLGRQGFADFTVTAVLGHLTSSDFGEDHRKWSSCDPFALFDAQIITNVSPDLRKVQQNLQREARNADILMIWTDCDREGEHIGSEVAAVCRRANRNIIVKRARFSAIIAAQIHQACRQANDLDMRQADAVEARINLDLRIGAAFTRLTTMGLQNRVAGLPEKQVISYGPCQFPTLGFVVDQYTRMQNFVPEPFWYIYVAIERQDEDNPDKVDTVEFKWRRNHLFGFEEAMVLYQKCVDQLQADVLKVETKPSTKWKPLPLTTVELQQSGSRLLHMTPKKVLDIAEKLYQKGLLSYPRTETDQYDKAFDFQSLIRKQTFDSQWGDFANKLVDGEFQRPRNGKKNDKAHPPIHPTNHAGDLQGDEKRVFELVTRRFLASCHMNAEGKQTTVEIEINGEFFSTSGLVVTRRNYLEVYPYDKWSDSALPDFQEGETFIPTVCELRDGMTSKPKLLTEADLVGLMDKNGIGTDATIAEHIAKIIERQYVLEKQESKIKYLLPSLLGVGLVEGFNKIGLDRSLSKPQLRAETEYAMQRICDGVMTKAEVLDQAVDQYKQVFLKVRRDFEIVYNSVNEYMHGQGESQDALRAAARGRGRTRGVPRGGAGGRGGRGGGAGATRRRRDEEDDDDDDNEDGFQGGGGGVNREGSTRGRRGSGTASRATGGTATGRAKYTRDGNPAYPMDDTITCDCNEPAIQRTVMKQDSAHVGRSFWTCPKSREEQCGYFEWTDEAGNGSAAAGPSRSANRPAAPPPPSKRPRTMGPSTRDNDGDDAVRCVCDLEAALLTVSKDGPNKGRKFWTCPNNPKAKCGFFQWDDESGGSTRQTYEPPPRAPSRTSRTTGTGTSQECFKCGQEGHWANSCPNDGDADYGSRSRKPATKSRSKSRTGAGSNASSGDCFNCGKSGHWSSDCPEPKRGR